MGEPGPATLLAPVDREATPSDRPDSLLPPDAGRLGKFRLITPPARVGRRMGAKAILAMSTGMEGFRKLVVIKRLHPQSSADARLRELFLQEARLAAGLNHPNVVQTYEVDVQGGETVLSMEYLEGQPVSLIARKWTKPANPRIVARIVSDALLGLHYAHEFRGFDGKSLAIVHRDVSPQNLFVTYEGVVKVLDFGIAKASSQATTTESGVLKGKVSYMSPGAASAGRGRSPLGHLLRGHRFVGAPLRQATIATRFDAADIPLSTQRRATRAVVHRRRHSARARRDHPPARAREGPRTALIKQPARCTMRSRRTCSRRVLP